MLRNVPVLDRLPEFATYKDTGCDVHPACLTCPLPQCKYDDPGWMQREERGQRDAEIARARLATGLPIEGLASRFHVSTRTVHRALRSAAIGPGRPVALSAS